MVAQPNKEPTDNNITILRILFSSDDFHMANALCKRGASRHSGLGRFPIPPKGHYAPWGILPRPDLGPRHKIPIRIAGTTVAQPARMDLGVRYPKMAVS